MLLKRFAQAYAKHMLGICWDLLMFIRHIRNNTKKISTISEPSALTPQRLNKCLGDTDHII